MQLSMCGYVALETGAMDPRWAAVRNERVPAISGTGDPRSVDSYVNKLLRYTPDRVDVWSPPADTLRTKTGDCEDFALLKRALLIAAGRADTDIGLVLVRDLISRQDHAVLVVDGLVLDSFNSLHLPTSQVRDYTPLRMFCADKAYIFGKAPG